MNLDNLQALLDKANPNRFTAGAVLHAFKLDGPSFTLVTGYHTYDNERAVKPDDIFDLASLSKVVSTTTVAMHLVQEKLLDLDRPIDAYLPERKTLGTPQPTPRQILAHCAGFPEFLPFYRTHADLSMPERRYTIATCPQKYPVQTETRYSDIGMMILALCMERITGMPLYQLADKLVFKPLHMYETGYNPTGSRVERCLPTELIAGGDGKTCWKAVVHDENARWFGGVAGHAGLFSTVWDLAKLARMLLREGDGLIKPEVIRLFTTQARLCTDDVRCLGWHSVSQPSSGGTLISPESYGHTGFTGTSFWMDPVNKLSVVLLTNAVHPRREDRKPYFPWRNEVHTEATRALL